MVDHASPVRVATLEAVQDQFTTWRSKPHRARRIPDELWDAAVNLCGEHSVCKVSRSLGLDYKALRLRCHESEASQSPQPFVELGPLWSHSEVFVECDNGNRHQMRIHCKGPVDARVVDLVKGFFESRR
jgi:hypothetical protein